MVLKNSWKLHLSLYWHAQKCETGVRLNGPEKKFIDMQNFFYNENRAYFAGYVLLIGENVRLWKRQIGAAGVLISMEV